MAVATRRPPPYKRDKQRAAEDHTVVKTPIHRKKKIDRSIVHNINTPNEKIQQYLEGMDWEVTYFNALLGEDDAPLPLDIYAPDAMIQYDEIHHMVLKVESPLTANEADDVEGTAKVTSAIVPTNGDVFKAILAGGREALLRVTSVEDGFYNNNNVYTITYKVDSFLDKSEERYKDLLSKVAREKYFDKDYIFTKSDPLLLAQDYRDKREIKENLDHVFHEWLRVGINKKQTITIPDLGKRILDPYLQSFIFSIIDYSQYDELIRVNRSDREPVKTLWDLLLSRNKFREDYQNKIGMVGRGVMARDPLYKSIRYSQVDGLVAFDADGNNRNHMFYNSLAGDLMNSMFGDMKPNEVDLNGYPVFLSGGRQNFLDGLNWVAGLPLHDDEVIHLTNPQSVNLFNLIQEKIDAYLLTLTAEDEVVDAEVVDPAVVGEIATTEDELAAILLDIGIDDDIVDYLRGKGLFERYELLDPKPTKTIMKQWLRTEGFADMFINWLEEDENIIVPEAMKTRIRNDIIRLQDVLIKIIPDKAPISGEYVVTEAFYTKDLINMSLLELLMNEYLEDRVVSHVSLLKIIDDIHNWDKRQKFYYIPIVYLLMLYVRRTAAAAG
jgi:hypothetical protein